MVLTVLKTVQVPQLQFIDKFVDIPVVVFATTDAHGPDFAETRGDSTGAFLGHGC